MSRWIQGGRVWKSAIWGKRVGSFFLVSQKRRSILSSKVVQLWHPKKSKLWFPSLNAVFPITRFDCDGDCWFSERREVDDSVEKVLQPGLSAVEWVSFRTLRKIQRPGTGLPIYGRSFFLFTSSLNTFACALKVVALPLRLRRSTLLRSPSNQQNVGNYVLISS